MQNLVLYNVTINVEAAIEAEWLQWMKTNYVPAALATGLFVESKIFKLLHDEEDGSVTYSVQYFAHSVNHINEYLQKHAPALVEKHMARYRNRHVAFHTLMQQV